MADILIRGMEMPGHCRRCPLRDNDDSHCVLQPASAETDTWEFQRKHCPLLPLPEGHGRLGDLDALQEEFKKYHDGKRLMLIDTALTIVPAEGGLRNDS